MGIIVTPKNYHYWRAETTWGTEDGAATAVHIPVKSYGPKLTVESIKGRPVIGLLQSKQSQWLRGTVQGQIVVPFYGYEPPSSTKSLAQQIMEWAAMNPEATELPSLTWYHIQKDGSAEVASLMHTGLRCNQFTLRGNGEQGTVEMAIDVFGKDEAALGASAEAIPDDREKLLEALFQDVVFTLGGSPVTIDSFEFTIQRNTKVVNQNSRRPSALISTTMIQALTITIKKDTDDYDEYRRAAAVTELTGTLAIQGLHNGTGASGTASKLLLTFNRLALANVDENFPADDLATQPMTFDCLKPDSSSDAVTHAWSLV